jgi:hypothetical protein
MFLSVVILGRFTTETHAMAPLHRDRHAVTYTTPGDVNLARKHNRLFRNRWPLAKWDDKKFKREMLKEAEASAAEAEARAKAARARVDELRRQAEETKPAPGNPSGKDT